MVKYKPTHEIAYYIPEDKEVDVYYVLKRREEGTPNKDSDLWSSRAQYKSGVGFRLRANKCTGKESYFSAWPGTYNTPEFREMVRRAGMSTKITSRKYRVFHLMHDILFYLNHDDGFKEALSASEAHFLPDWGRRTSADIEIIHTDDFRREKTLFSMTDQYRVREIDTDERLFTLDIKSWKDVECQNFDKFGKTLTVRWWENFEQGELKKEESIRKQKEREWRAFERALEESEEIGRSIVGEVANEEMEKDLNDRKERGRREYLRRRELFSSNANLANHLARLLYQVSEHREEWGSDFEFEIDSTEAELTRLVGFFDTLRWIKLRAKEYHKYEITRLIFRYIQHPRRVNYTTDARLYCNDYDLSPTEFLSSILDLEISSLPPWGKSIGKYDSWTVWETAGTIREAIRLDDFFSENGSLEEINEFLEVQKIAIDNEYLGALLSMYQTTLGELPPDSFSRDIEYLLRVIRDVKIKQEELRNRMKDARARYFNQFGEMPADNLDLTKLEELIGKEVERKKTEESIRKIEEEYLRVFRRNLTSNERKFAQSESGRKMLKNELARKREKDIQIINQKYQRDLKEMASMEKKREEMVQSDHKRRKKRSGKRLERDRKRSEFESSLTGYHRELYTAHRRAFETSRRKKRNLNRLRKTRTRGEAQS